MNRMLLRYGFVLILLALVSGMFVPALKIPRLGLSAHTIGVLSGTLILAIGAIWGQFRLSATLSRVMAGSWLYSSYANWLGCLLGAFWGTGRATPVASQGALGAAMPETAVSLILYSVALTSLIAVGLSLWGLRGPAPET